jgi:hypothetical protein
MELRARDFEPPIVEGTGAFTVVSENAFSYEITGTAPDLGHTLRALTRLEADRYDGRNRFRLVMWDADGREWAGGWTIPRVEPIDDGFRCYGSCEMLGTSQTGSALGGSSEARFLIPRNHVASLIFARFVTETCDNGERRSRRTIEVLGTPVTFEFDPAESVLTIFAPFSRTLPPPTTENWLGEPLRILFGQLVYPRLVARHFADGRSTLDIRRSPRWQPGSEWTALWVGKERLTDAEGFFDLYAGLLALVATGGNFESHTVTEFYEQVIQATRGSPWVWTMTLASSIEGLARMLVPVGSLRADADEKALNALIAYLEAWEGPTRLKDTIIGRAGTLDQLSTSRALYDLAKAGVGTKDQVDAWNDVRHAVMHGNLISPYTSEESDRRNIHLADLLRALTRELVWRLET